MHVLWMQRIRRVDIVALFFNNLDLSLRYFMHGRAIFCLESWSDRPSTSSGGPIRIILILRIFRLLHP